MCPTPITRHVRRINTPVVLHRMPLDTRPHLLQARVELVLVLRLVFCGQVDKVVSVVGRVARGAAGCGEWG